MQRHLCPLSTGACHFIIYIKRQRIIIIINSRIHVVTHSLLSFRRLFCNTHPVDGVRKKKREEEEGEMCHHYPTS
jgi:hypothetical protein